jgi:DNA-binding transcriptional LysR family regulator
MLDWNDLRFAIAVAESGTLSAAARTLRVNQTTVGRRIAVLEEALGVTLFLRSPQGYVTTSAGVRLLDSVRELSANLAAIESGLRGDEKAPRGRVRVATTEVTAQHLFDAAIPALHRAYPEIEVELITANTQADLAVAEADLAVRFVRPEGAALVSRKLGVMRYGVYATRAYIARRGAPKSVDDLAGHEYVSPSRELETGPEARWLAEHARDARSVLRSNSMPALARAAGEGVGFVVLPTALVEDHSPLRLLFRADEIAPRTAWLVLHRDARTVTRVRVVADAIVDALSARLARATRS